MKKGFKYYLGAWAIMAVIFNAIVFVTPNELAGMSKFGGAFWSGYIFIMLAMSGQLICARFAFKAKNAEKLFLRLPLVTISYTAMIVSVVLGTLCMAVPNIPNWIGAVVCFLILGFTAIAVLKAVAAADIVENLETRVKAKTLFIKKLTVDMGTLMTQAKSDEVNAEVKKIYDAVRYSDPTSSDALSEVEAQIAIQIGPLTEAVSADDRKAAKSIVNELLILVNDRNKKCMLLK